MRTFPTLLAPSTPLELSPATLGQQVLFSWCGWNVARPFRGAGVPAFSGTFPRVKSRYGAGLASAGGVVRATYAGAIPLGSFENGCTIEVLCAITAAQSLAGLCTAGDTGGGGTARGIRAFTGSAPCNISVFFRGSGIDYDTSVPWRADGLRQHVFVSIAGKGSAPISVYRDGLVISSGTTSSSVTSSGASAVTIGDFNIWGAGAPTGVIYKVAYYNRALTASEIWAKTQDPYGDYVVPDTIAPYAFVAAGGSFQAAWAANANFVASTGARVA